MFFLVIMQLIASVGQLDVILNRFNCLCWNDNNKVIPWTSRQCYKQISKLVLSGTWLLFKLAFEYVKITY